MPFDNEGRPVRHIRIGGGARKKPHEEARLTIRIENKYPIELMDLTRSFNSFADEYHKHLSLQPDLPDQANIRLFIKEIKTGSVIADLVAMSLPALPVISYMAYANSIISFSGYLKKAYDSLLGRSKAKLPLAKQNYENLSNIVEPIAKDNASQLTVQNVINGNVQISITLNSIEANAAQNAAKREIQALAEPLSGVQEKVLIYWYQARKDVKSQVGDRGIIESISKKPVKVIFGTEGIKARMLLETENPFKFGYVVDVVVETVKDKPAVYKIINLYHKVELPEEPEPPDPNVPLDFTDKTFGEEGD